MEEKPKVFLGYIGYKTAELFAQTTEDMQVYKNLETDEVISSPPLNKVFTIENYRTDLDYKSGRELRRERRKQQRKNK